MGGIGEKEGENMKEKTKALQSLRLAREGSVGFKKEDLSMKEKTEVL